MEAVGGTVGVSKNALWAGRVVSALPVIMLVMSGVMKVMRLPMVVDGFKQLGYSERVIVPIGIVELACAALYVLPPTAVLGAILVTGYLGGATATHVRAGQWPTGAVVLGVLAWVGLYLRDRRVRAAVWRRD